ncbi:SRPBCC domain-containing protein [Phenylobacterium sp.]|uniref:SRPBCC domain-containing protein n=1 Tax=Phenylobacterium sp. TaxID=1871053 RepID=UPI002E365CFF|nr:SRPBCC domain-containing protein [Phenylobacterium sp.]HEX3366546.1 SRPBCC domain-containing protein [Phenylobacterium sp.]
MADGVSQLVAAPPEAVWAAFMDPAVLVEWLPPAQMTGVIDDFDLRVGGGYRMSLFYPPDEREFRGKTTEREDRLTARFVALSPPGRMVQAITFESPDPAFHGEMTMTWTFEPAPGGTRVTVVTENLPPGVRAEDNDEGARLSLEQLARRFA